ncbi:hypothetical protein INE85_02772 [Phocaeicola vulgatus]|nr:hypothetical protein INE85_02772 [Phocaeicola vulgatus]
MSWFLLDRNLKLLEPYDWKLSRTVLRGERGSNAPDLPGTMLLDELMILCAMLVGSMTDHCALAFPAISRNRQIVMITFVLIFTFGLSG